MHLSNEVNNMELQAEIELQKQKVMELKEKLLAEERKVEELKLASPALADAENLLKQAIARTENCPDWVKTKFWEMLQAEVKNILGQSDCYRLELDSAFYWLKDIITHTVINFQSTFEDNPHFCPYSTGNLTFDEQNAVWHIDIHLPDGTICYNGVVLTMTSILPTPEERLPSVQWIGSFKNWVWGFDPESGWGEELRNNSASLVELLASVGDFYQCHVSDCLNAIAKKQIIELDELSEVAILSLLSPEGLECILEDLWRKREIDFMDANKRPLDVHNWDEFDFSEVGAICYKNFSLTGLILTDENNQKVSLDSDINSGKTKGAKAKLAKSDTQPKEKNNPLEIEVVLGKGIKWNEDGILKAFSHSDLVSDRFKKSNLPEYKRDSLKAIAEYMKLNPKAKMKSDLWDRIQSEYLHRYNSMPNKGVTNF